MSAQSRPIIGAEKKEPAKSCKTCQFWLTIPNEKKPGPGMCHFAPPVVILMPGPAGLDGRMQVAQNMVRPITEPNDWCNHHTADGEMHHSEAIIAAVADLIEPITEMRDFLRQLVDTMGAKRG